MVKYKLFEGVKFLVDAKGLFLKDEQGAKIEADETATEFVETTETETEVEPEVEEAKAFFSKIAVETAQKTIKSLNLPSEMAKAMGLEISKAMSKGSVPTFTKEVGDTVKAISLDEVVKGIKTANEKVGASFSFNVKTLSELSSLTGELPEEDRQPGVTGIAKQDPLILNIVPSETTTSNQVTWVEVENETGSPATTAELAALPEKDYTFIVMSAKVYKVGVLGKHSNEVLEDLGQLVSFVQTELKRDLELKVDQKLLSGSGVNDLVGVQTFAPVFSAGALAGTIATPNMYDVLVAAIANIRVAGKGKFRPNYILMNPMDVAGMTLSKGVDGHYLLPTFVTNNGVVIKNVSIIEHDGITAGDFVVGDFTKFHAPVRRGISLQIATENKDDFEKDMVTMRLTTRLASYNKANENGAFVQGDFATAITALEI